MSKIKNPEAKVLSFSTTMRNPERIANFLKVLLPFENHILNSKIIMKVIKELIKNKLYIPNYAKNNFKDILDSNENFNDLQIEDIIKNSPQNHKEKGFPKGWESRFDTFYKLCMEFGFCYYQMEEALIISNTGHLLCSEINNEDSKNNNISDIFLNCMMKYQSNNPFRKNLNSNVPLLLLLNVMKILKEKTQDSKIFKTEIAFFLCWRDSNALSLAKKILDFRKKYPSFKYTNEIVYQECLKILQSSNTKRFKISQICGESIDEYIRKMRITGIISLRGNGRFIDINSFEIEKINYVIKNYSVFSIYKSEKDYFDFMGNIDTKILKFKQKINPRDEKNIKLNTLKSFAKNYTKEKIYKELLILSSKTSFSKDEIFKFIPEPTRFEFLSAIALKQNFDDVEILPNYIIDDEGLPKNHAGGNQADIECIGKDFKGIVEVSLIYGTKQLVSEMIPITRHFEEFTENAKTKTIFAFFIAPKIFKDSITYSAFINRDEKIITNFDINGFIKGLKKCKYFIDLLELKETYS